MPLVNLLEGSISFGGPKILDKLNLQVETGERIALLGRNGTGKTTLMRVIAGELKLNDGEIFYQKGINVSLLTQEVPAGISGTIFDVVLSGLGKKAKLLSDYHHVTHRLQTEHTPELMHELDKLQHEIDKTEGWDLNAQIEKAIAELKLDPDAEFDSLSGGQKRRALLARALVVKPEVLLLDEPTNHLDIDSIGWLEGFIRSYSGTVFFVTHDRMFMSNLATRIIELDRGKIFNWACDYKTFLDRKERVLNTEAAQWAEFDKKLAEEEIWIRRGVKARRCREAGRVNKLMRMRQEKREQRKAIGQVRFRAQETDISGRQVIKTFNLGFSYPDKDGGGQDGEFIVKELSTEIMRGDKIGIIGPNGSGKTTLIKLLLQKLAPTTGKVKLGTNLEIAYFDQLREQLDETKTVMQNVSGEGDMVTINGKPKHVIGYLQEFLFTPERAMTPISVLSGGERNRLLLARLFMQPFNLLVMDEPTNDLDVETLELLEELLVDFTGTLLLVSHDRAFLNNVVTSTMVLEGNGVIGEFPGGYDDWLMQRKVPETKQEVKCESAETKKDRPEKSAPKKKLSFKEKHDLEKLPGLIEQLEKEQNVLYALLADVVFCQNNPAKIEAAKNRLVDIEKELTSSYDRWAFLEKLAKELEG